MLSDVLIAHGTALILLLSVLEGPIVSVTAGFLAAKTYFDWHMVLPLLVCGDLIGDAIYYVIGRTGAALHRFAGLRGSVTPMLQQQLRHNATRMLLIGKWTHSVGCLVLIGSGMMRLNLPRFLLVNLLATLPKTAVLFGFGYCVADRLAIFDRHLWLIAGLAFAGGLASILLVLRGSGRVWVRR